MQHSENIADLATALAKAQAVVEGAKKDSNNPHFKSKYADLASVWSACREALTDNGLSVIQSPGLCHDGKMEMTTMLMHSSGQWVRDTLSIPLQKIDAQGYGSATTYARRYALAAVVGVSPDDDDGNAASAGRGASNDRAKAITPQQADQLQKLADEVGADLRKFCAYMKIDAITDLPAVRFSDARDALEAKRQKEAA